MKAQSSLTVKDLLDSNLDVPMVLEGVEYKDPKNDIPWTILLNPVENFDAREDTDGIYKVFISLKI